MNLGHGYPRRDRRRGASHGRDDSELRRVPLTTLPTTERPVVVVGGGIAGLTSAFQLAASNVPVVLLEERRQVGGYIGSSRSAAISSSTGRTPFSPRARRSWG